MRWNVTWEEREEALERCFFRALDVAVHLEIYLSHRFSTFERMFNSVRAKTMASKDMRVPWEAVRAQHKASLSLALVPILEGDRYIVANTKSAGSGEEQEANHDEEQKKCSEEDPAEYSEKRHSEEDQEGYRKENQDEHQEKGTNEEVQENIGLLTSNARASNEWQASIATGRDEQETHVQCVFTPNVKDLVESTNSALDRNPRRSVRAERRVRSTARTESWELNMHKQHFRVQNLGGTSATITNSLILMGAASSPRLWALEKPARKTASLPSATMASGATCPK